MPYIKKELRERLDEDIENLLNAINDIAVDFSSKEEEEGIHSLYAKCLAYIFFKLLRRCYEHGNWWQLTESLKILESVKLEFTRRFINLVELHAIDKNGDVE